MNFTLDYKIKIILIVVIFFQLFFLSNVRLDFKVETLRNSFNKNYGANYILPENILELKSIIKKDKLKRFNISNEIKKNAYLLQRITEFLYPAKIDFNKKEIFYLKIENEPNNCKVIKEFNNWFLGKC